MFHELSFNLTEFKQDSFGFYYFAVHVFVIVENHCSKQNKCRNKYKKPTNFELTNYQYNIMDYNMYTSKITKTRSIHFITQSINTLTGLPQVKLRKFSELFPDFLIFF